MQPAPPLLDYRTPPKPKPSPFLRFADPVWRRRIIFRAFVLLSLAMCLLTMIPWGDGGLENDGQNLIIPMDVDFASGQSQPTRAARFITALGGSIDRRTQQLKSKTPRGLIYIWRYQRGLIPLLPFQIGFAILPLGWLIVISNRASAPSAGAQACPPTQRDCVAHPASTRYSPRHGEKGGYRKAQKNQDH
jgi:hypothetical protein